MPSPVEPPATHRHDDRSPRTQPDQLTALYQHRAGQLAGLAAKFLWLM
jgi:hypothetical protein